MNTSPPLPEFPDIIIYGGTSAAITAAVQAVKMGKTVLVLSPDRHLGGLSSGGLGWTDSGHRHVIGGLSREFYHRVWKHYSGPGGWTWQQRGEFGNRGQDADSSMDDATQTMWTFEPHVAERIYEEWVVEMNIPVVRDIWLDRASGVRIENGRIISIRTLNGRVWRGRMFIDATYEGDLMAAAGVSHTVGREANSVYGETWNGSQPDVRHHAHYFKMPVDPYRVPGDPSSGLLPRISATLPAPKNAGDRLVQAYCFRMCLTNDPRNRVPFPKPEGYDPAQYELLARIFDAGWREAFHKFDPIPNHKTDANNHGPFSTDNIGANHAYPEADYETRHAIIAEHETYQKGLMYFLANDPRVPDEVRLPMSRWGLAADEFADNGHWPHQLYVREARRLIGRFVMTENEVLGRKPVPESIGMGSYALDSHNVQRYVTPEGTVQNEGDIGVKTTAPYSIALGSIVPREGQCENLLVPVCASTSHIAYGSVRMEPVFMILGQSAAAAAGVALEEGVSVQQIDYNKLRQHLLEANQILETGAKV